MIHWPGLALFFVFVGLWAFLIENENARMAMTPAQRRAEEDNKKYWADHRHAKNTEIKAQRKVREEQEKRFR